VAIDPVTLAVLAGRLAQVADEMDATLFRSAFNPIIAEAHDASHGLYHADSGDTLVQGSAGLPVFVGSMSGAVDMVIGRIQARARAAGAEPTMDGALASGALLDGDVYCTNDPYEAGTHLNDMKLVRPYLRNGRVWCHLASVGHFTDVGGAVPGNYNPAATEVHQEGVCLPPMRLRRGGVLDEDVVELVCSIGRAPRNAYGDLHAQLNALDLGVRRLDELLDEFGDDLVAAAIAELTERSARLMRSHLSELPDGTWRAVDHLDNDGGASGPIEVALEMTVQGDGLHLDFTGTSPAVAGPVNISATTARAACYVALKHLFREVPANAGCLEPVRITLPDGSLLAARHPRPVGGYTETILRVMDLVFRCMAEADPALSNGCSYGTINALSISSGGAAGAGREGTGGQGDPWVMFAFHGGGLGGSPESDGLNHGNAPLSTATIPPLEIMESRYPVRYTRFALRPDSGGPGRHRGGLGASYEVELLAPEADAFVFGDRALFAPKGVAGGAEAAANRVVVVRDGEESVPELGSKVTGQHLRAGDRIRIESPGGGGYGDPLERATAAVARDIALGYVSADVARRDYGVVLDASGTVDEEATAAERAARRTGDGDHG
jgi:N-methylhydantoinase B